MRAFAFVACVLVVVSGQYVTRTIDSGPIVGVYNSSTGVTSFLGVPYAADTSGTNRFMAPQPVTPWSTPLNCTWWGPGCAQINHNPDVPPVTSEDCLNLNVFVPSTVSPSDSVAVMIFFHGGAWAEGSNQGPFYIYDGGQMATLGDVIVVTSNYRLGAFGFLVTGELKGNYAILDQRQAMQWVRANIAVFGGDPNQVTIFGESAGAMSVGLHMIAPGSQGLFQRVIMESNVGLLYHTLPEALDYGQAFCKAVNCSDCDLACLQGLSTAMVEQGWRTASNNDWAFILANWRHIMDGFVQEFAPTIDGEILPYEPEEAFQNGKVNPDVAVMEGSNAADGQTFVYAGVSTWLPDFLAEVVDEAVFYPDGEAVAKRYANSSVHDGRWLFGEVLTDYLFRCFTQRYAEASYHNGHKTFVYRYTHVFSASWLWPKFGLPDICETNACHMSELPLVFGNEVQTPSLNVTFTPQERQLSNNMINYWTSFAKFGDPNLSTPPPAVTWPTYDPTARNGIVLDEILTTESSANLCAFWDGVGYDH